MREQTSILSLIFLLGVVGCLAGSPLGAADRKTGLANWDSIKEELSQGQQIKVVMNNMKAYKGLFQKVSDDGITLTLRTGNKTLARQEILRVSYNTGTHHVRNAGIGAAIGGGSLVALCAAACNGFGSLSGEGVAILLPLGGAIGAGVGAALPSAAWRDVYRAH